MGDGAADGVRTAGVRSGARIRAAAVQAGLVGRAREVAGAAIVCFGGFCVWRCVRGRLESEVAKCVV